MGDPSRARAAAILIALLLAACGSSGAAELSRRPAALEVPLLDEPTTTTTSAPAPTTTAAAGATTSTTAPPGLGVGASGPEVLALEQKLERLEYYVGTADGSYDGDTRDAVLAFQKVTGMERTGRATDDVVAAVDAGSDHPPRPLVPAGGIRRVEIDLDRQVLFFYEGNNLEVILNTSTGNNQRFCSEGWCRRAVTPTGGFTVYEKRTGWERSPLGWLYNSQYFNGGIAIHGSRSVPAYPASHGCVRISMNAAEWFPDRLTLGTPVYVVAAGEPVPAPVVPAGTPVSTPTTIVPDTTATAEPTTTTTTRNLLSELLNPPPTGRP